MSTLRFGPRKSIARVYAFNYCALLTLEFSYRLRNIFDVYYMPGTVLGSVDATVNKANKTILLWTSHLEVEVGPWEMQ